LRATVDSLLEPWLETLGRDRDAYENHVCRVLALCGMLAAKDGLEADPDTRLAWLVAAVFHDLGIWSDGTWDYIDPSVHLAHTWLAHNQREDLVQQVERMIREHHGVRARGNATDPVEIFRRADLIDVWLCVRSYGVGRKRYRAILRRHPYSGFHRRLVVVFLRHFVRRPWDPLPMFRI
jgi:hypothetical protein